MPSPTPIGFEGDINRWDPRVSSWGDGRLDGDDLTWFDLFANGKVCPEIAPKNEFQRMDVADLTSRGDGAIGTDRVALEMLISRGILIPAGGPAEPTAPLCTGASSYGELSKAAPTDGLARALRIGSVIPTSESYVEVPVEADLNGDEVTLQFTAHFDPSLLSFSGESGVDANPDVIRADIPDGSRVIVNATRAADGDVGVIIDFNGSGAYPAHTAEQGTRRLLLLRFALCRPTHSGEVSILSFDDGVFATRASNDVAQPLPIDGGLRGGAIVFDKDKRPLRTP